MKFKLKMFLMLTLILVTAFSFTVNAFAKTNQPKSKANWQIAKELCRKAGYKNIKLLNSNRMTDKAFWKIIDNRKGKRYIIVEKVVSVSDGTGYGWYSTKTKGTRYIIGYNKRVPKGKLVTSYVIWNPRSNECDDILYVIDNQKVRS